MPNMGGVLIFCLWNSVKGFGVQLINGEAQPGFRLRFFICQLNAFPSIVSVHCVAALLSFGGIWDIWYEALAVLYCLNQWWGRYYFAIYCLFFFKLFAVTQPNSCLLCSAFLSFHLFCPVFHFWWQAFFFIFCDLYFCFFPSVEVDEKLLYFVYKNLGKQAFVRMKK